MYVLIKCLSHRVKFKILLFAPVVTGFFETFDDNIIVECDGTATRTNNVGECVVSASDDRRVRARVSKVKSKKRICSLENVNNSMQLSAIIDRG